MFDTDDALAAACRDTTASMRDALAWVEATDNEAVRAAAPRMVKDLRKAVVQSGKLEHAARRKMCVGVFGASQAGKSYLISALARRPGTRLMARFGDGLVDFIAHINPEGGIESTGLVTRFTTDRDTAAPPGHPVRLGLMSEVDVIKVLANSFAEDLLHGDADDPEDASGDAERKVVYAALDSLRGAAGAGAGAGAATRAMAVEDVYDLEDYCLTRLGKTPRLRLLRACGFWDEAAALAPRLPLEGRVRLFSLLWEELPVFTRLYERLARSLEALGHARTAHCALAALVEAAPGGGDGWTRSPRSIINVSTLGGLGRDGGEDDAVPVVAAGGASLRLPRADLAALVAELFIIMDDQPLPFFAHTDLLDFPGARTRKPQPKINEVLDAPATRTENFLRGKVAYLFERYCDEQELNSMLLCVGPSNQEVATLPGMIEQWVESTHGRTAADRARVETALLFVLTKFDTVFERGAGKDADGTRFDNRLKASLIEPFAQTAHRTRWVTEWHPGKPFDSLFWVRNPNIEQRALFDYADGPGLVETGVRADMRGFIDTLRAAHLDNALVRRHVADAAVAWDAGMALNDGGIGRVAERLAALCRPEVKRSQVAQRLRVLRVGVGALLAPHHVSGDVETLREEKRALAAQLLRMLGGSLSRGRLGEVQYALRLRQDAALAVFRAAERAAAQLMAAPPSVSAPAASAAAKPAQSPPADDVLALLGLDEPAPVPSAVPSEAPGAPPARPADLADRFVSDLKGAWMDGVADLAGDDGALAYLGLDGPLVLRLAQEIQLAALRLGVFAGITEAVRAAQQFKGGEREAWVWRQVGPATARFNDFLATFGFDAPAGTEVRDFKDQPKRIFVQRPDVEGLPALSGQVAAYEQPGFVDWLLALQAVVRGNADFQAGIAGNVEDNARLGRILAGLAEEAA